MDGAGCAHILSECLAISSKWSSKLLIAAHVLESAERGSVGVCRYQVFLRSHIPRTRGGCADVKTQSGPQNALENVTSILFIEP
jgi:hypothetical protein